MTKLSQLAAILQQGRGLTASLLGLPYDLYRIDAGVIGSVVSGDPDVVGFSAKMEREKKQNIEANTFELVVVNAKCNNATLELGDILVGTDPRDLAVYAYAQYRETDDTIFIRCDAFATLGRPIDAAAVVPSSNPGPVAISGEDEDDSEASLVAVLTMGAYAFIPPNVNVAPAVIPIGLQATARAGGPRTESLPTDDPTARYVAYIPPLPGVDVQQDDILTVARTLDSGIVDTRRFMLSSPYEQRAGFVGTIAIAAQIGA